MKKLSDVPTELYLSELHELTKALCVIASPSGQEQKKAKFIADYIRNSCNAQVHIDEVCNVTCTVKGQGGGRVLICSHIDTVFPHDTPLGIRIENGLLYCPSVFDNSVHCASLICALKILLTSGIVPVPDIVFAFTSCEEGTGNLKGIRHIMQSYQNQFDFVIAADGSYHQVVTSAVGSSRFKITVHTQGGHSWFDSGNSNAVEILARMVCDFYDIQIAGNPKCTLNVGVISGGNSINSIASEASLLLDLRSENSDALQHLVQSVRTISEKYIIRANSIELECISDRPCGSGKVSHQVKRAIQAVEQNTGMRFEQLSSSTDINIPIALGIPSIVIGGADGGNIHTAEEYLKLDSIAEGMPVLLAFCAWLAEFSNKG